MSRTLSFAALSTLLLATAVEAYAGATAGNDGYRGTEKQAPTVTTRMLTATDAASLQGDNCGVDGYPWLGADGQTVEG